MTEAFEELPVASGYLRGVFDIAGGGEAAPRVS